MELLIIYCLNYFNKILINWVILSPCYTYQKYGQEIFLYYIAVILFSLLTCYHNYPPTLYFHHRDLTLTYLVCDWFLFIYRIQRYNWRGWRLWVGGRCAPFSPDQLSGNHFQHAWNPWYSITHILEWGRGHFTQDSWNTFSTVPPVVEFTNLEYSCT